MKKNISIFFLFLSIVTYSTTPEVRSSRSGQSAQSSRPIKTISNWQLRCSQAQTLNMQEQTNKHTALSATKMNSIITKFCSQSAHFLSNAHHWVDNKKPDVHFFNNNQAVFEPYVQKLEVAPGAIVAVHGDLHGDVISLNNFLQYLVDQGYLTNDFKIKNPQFYMLFLGDYVDRGSMGAEVIATILKLKQVNHENVFLVRGNHEDNSVSARYGFKNELEQKFGAYTKLHEKIERIYNYMPVALYLKSGCDALLCCHGGLEIGFDKTAELLNSPGKIKNILIGEYKRKEAVAHLSQKMPQFTQIVPQAEKQINKPATAYQVGFMWNDFTPQKTTPSFWQLGRGLTCNQQLTNLILERYSSQGCGVHGVLRAHQHSPAMMPHILNQQGTHHTQDTGVAKLWDPKQKPAGYLWHGIVCTFNAAPQGNAYGQTYGYDYDSFGLLKVGATFNDWSLEVIRLDKNGNVLP